MFAIAYDTPLPIADSKALIGLDTELPRPEEQDILVEVHAISVNPVDVKIRASAVSPNGPRILGWDAAGVVVDVGRQVTLFKPSDEVYYAGALDRPGSNARFQLVDQRIAAHKPRSLDFPAAAALPLTTITAWEALFDRLDIRRPVPGIQPALLIIGGSGGVGSMAIQLARQVKDLTVIATASRLESMAWCKKLGAHHVIDHALPLMDQLSQLGIPAPGFVLSTTHTEMHFESIASLIAPQGRLYLIDDPKTVDITKLKRKSISLHWEFMFTRSLLKTSDMHEQHRLLTEVAKLIDNGEIRTTQMDTITPINVKNLRLAHQKIESQHTIGKIVLHGWE